jgi:hypothetical protein
MDKQLGTITEEATKALEQIAARKAVLSLGSNLAKQENPTADQIRAGIAKAWTRLAELKANPDKYGTTPEILYAIAAMLAELESETDQNLNWSVAAETGMQYRFDMLKAFASVLATRLGQSSQYLTHEAQNVINSGCQADAVLLFQLQVISFDVLRYLLARAIEEMPVTPVPQA